MQERNANARANLGDLLDLPVTAATEFANWNRDVAAPESGEAEADPGTVTATTALRPSEAEMRYLRAVVENPGKPSSVYPKLAQMGSRRALKIRGRLCELGYLREYEVSTGGRGRNAIVIEPLEPGRALVTDGAPAVDREVTS